LCFSFLLETKCLRILSSCESIGLHDFALFIIYIDYHNELAS
jgi:hypothetical protein